MLMMNMIFADKLCPQMNTNEAVRKELHDKKNDFKAVIL
jgi:hypothetical protein